MIGIILFIRNIIWGTPTLVLLTVFGIYFTARSRFFLPRAICSVFRGTVGGIFRSGGRESFRAAAVSLGGTVGVGSIAGVAMGIAAGGAGSIFWMWICSFFGAGLRYAEVCIAMRGGAGCGAAGRLLSLGKKRLAAAFCIFCVLASFGTGNLAQSKAAAGALGTLGLPRFACAAICFALVAVTVSGGSERISAVSAFVLPAASLIYLSCCGALLIRFPQSVPAAFSRIFSQAFGADAVRGGISGELLQRAVREGFAKSVFSTECGMGSSPLAHSSAGSALPEEQAKWGVFEVFFDTFVVSTVTAVCLIGTGSESCTELFSLLGGAGRLLLPVLTAVFALASVVSWCFYAGSCITLLPHGGRTAYIVFRTVFSLCAFAAPLLPESDIWSISDILNAMMMLPNLTLLFICRKEIKKMR